MNEQIKPLALPLVGKKLPDFSYDALSNGQLVKGKLSDYRGRWLAIVFYPGDFTFVCPTELKEIADLYARFQELGAEVLAVSTDSVYSHLAWHDMSKAIGSVQYPMIADPAGIMSHLLGVYIEGEGVALRGTFIVDPDGIIRAVEVNDNGVGRSAAELLRRLQAVKYVTEHKGEACPASWKPGEKTLKPGAELVGKI
jgi:NADH-dependent peroxiredoxin subunit C